MKTYKLQSGSWDNSIQAEDLAGAQAQADKHIGYNQESMLILDSNGDELSRRSWWGCTDGIEDCNNPIRYGDFGFYGDWQ